MTPSRQVRGSLHVRDRNRDGRTGSMTGRILDSRRACPGESTTTPYVPTAAGAASLAAARAMLRAMPPKTAAWNGATLHQYAWPSSPCG